MMGCSCRDEAFEMRLVAPEESSRNLQARLSRQDQLFPPKVDPVAAGQPGWFRPRF